MNSETKDLREYVPLKQGLRPVRTPGVVAALALREYVPLKQGLRPAATAAGLTCSNASESMFH